MKEGTCQFFETTKPQRTENAWDAWNAYVVLTTGATRNTIVGGTNGRRIVKVCPGYTP